MLGASARYSCFYAPVETGTPPSEPPCERLVKRLNLLRLGVINAEGVYGDPFHDLLLPGPVVPVSLAGDDGVGGLHALNDLAKGGVAAVQVGGLVHHDEELAAGGIGVHGPGHGQHPPVVGQVILESILGELPLDGVARTAHAGALGTAALDHKAGDAAVEDQAVVKALLDQGNEVVHAVGSRLGVELRLHDGAVFHLNGDDGMFGIRHGFLSFLMLPDRSTA